ncbi:hypothetical protein ACFQZE_20785 [Paenibacillus sp. GCM10027627]|uniref:hypothetical protein n=1 Tax=unclassified Paenibacillus TaxID=185978 RepID=UPI00364015A9
MLLRKSIAGYLASFATVIYYVLHFTLFDGQSLSTTFEDLFQSLSFLSLYVFPVVFVYGSLVSIGVELAAKRWVSNRTLNWLLMAAGHMIFGMLFALPFRIWGFVLLCGASALVYFLIDRLLVSLLKLKLRNAVVTGAFLLPIAVITVSGLFWQSNAAPLPAFDQAAAVKFATSSKDTVIDSFPKHVGMETADIQGYWVTKETAVQPVGEEKYEVTFTEEWSKENESGERWYTYIVDRHSMLSKDSGGITPPYEQASSTN